MSTMKSPLPLTRMLESLSVFSNWQSSTPACHVTFSSIVVEGSGRRARFDDGGMVTPGGKQNFLLSGDVPETADVKIHYQAVNDYGGASQGDAALDGGTSK